MTDKTQTMYELSVLISNLEERIAGDQAQVRILKGARAVIQQAEEPTPGTWVHYVGPEMRLKGRNGQVVDHRHTVRVALHGEGVWNVQPEDLIPLPESDENKA